jgi:adenylate cyclase
MPGVRCSGAAAQHGHRRAGAGGDLVHCLLRRGAGAGARADRARFPPPSALNTGNAAATFLGVIHRQDLACPDGAEPLPNGQSVWVEPAAEPPSGDRQTLWQRMVRRRLLRRAGKHRGEALTSDDWRATWALNDSLSARVVHRIWRTLPSSPRCGMCSAPFGGPGRFVVRPLGYRPSRKNPTLCATCVEASPPGGMKMYTGVMFADLRGFTARSETADPEEMSHLLRRFYGCAEGVLFPEAIIDKVVGDQVMALYLPDVQRRVSRDRVPALMVEHANRLLRAVGYGSAGGPFVELGIGLDVGEAFVGNIGERALFDFTAVGDVVNTASRLQAQAAGGEIVMSRRVADGLPTPLGTLVELDLKGKAQPELAYRVAGNWDA